MVGLAIDPSGAIVFSASEDRIKAFRLETAEIIAELPCEGRGLARLVPAPGGWLLAISPDGIRGWNLDTGAERSLPVFLGKVQRCVALPDGAGRLLTCAGNQCTIWDLSTFEPLRVLTHGTTTVRAATLSTQGDRVVSIDEDEVVRLWDARTGAGISTWPRATRGDRTLPLQAVQIDPDGRWVLSTTLADMYLWDVERGAYRWHVEGPSPDLSLFVPSEGGRVAVMTGHNHGLEAWDLVTGRRLSSFPGVCPREPVAAFGPDERTLIVCDEDGFGFQVVDVEIGSRVESTQRHTSPIKRLLMAPDGRTLLTAGAGEPIVTWDVATASPTGKLGDSPARGALSGDDVPPVERLLDRLLDQLERLHVRYRSAARAGDGDAEDYRDEARWIEAYWGEVQALETSPGARRADVLDRLESLVGEVGGNGVWMGPRDVKEMLARRREGPDDDR